MSLLGGTILMAFTFHYFKINIAGFSIESPETIESTAPTEENER